MSISYDFTKSPDELVSYLKSKGLQTTFNYEEMLHEAHQRAFTVAKVTKLDLLSDIHSSISEGLKEGKPFSQWADEIQPTLQKKGWWGEVEAIDPRTGEVKDIFVGSRRLRTIYDTNMKTAYAKGRYDTQMNSYAEYFYYSSVLDQLTRPTHAKHHGTILPKTDPFWNKNYPPNGWGCRCKVRAYTKEELESKGLKPSKFTPPQVHEKDWDYNPGKTNFFDTKYKSPCQSAGVNAKTDCENRTDYKKSALPLLQELLKTHAKKAPKELKAGKTREDGYKIIKQEILGKESATFIKTPFEDVLITDEILKHAVEKEARERYAHFMIETLKDPLEVWYTRFDDGKIRPQYIALFDTPKAMLVSVIIGRDGSLMWNFMNSNIPKMNKKRVGEWFWKKY